VDLDDVHEWILEHMENWSGFWAIGVSLTAVAALVVAIVAAIR